jgi:hypothetical protein
MKKLFKKLIVWAMREDDAPEPVNELRSSRKSARLISTSDSNIRSSGMIFHVYAAEGGTVIETSFYDPKNDRNDNRLYIIPDGEDFTGTLGQIVSMERIKSWH